MEHAWRLQPDRQQVDQATLEATVAGLIIERDLPLREREADRDRVHTRTSGPAELSTSPSAAPSWRAGTGGPPASTARTPSPTAIGTAELLPPDTTSRRSSRAAAERSRTWSSMLADDGGRPQGGSLIRRSDSGAGS
jgi:hypothetical protein